MSNQERVCYLSDGAYARFNAMGDLVLTANAPDASATDRVVIDATGWDMLVEFVKHPEIGELREPV